MPELVFRRGGHRQVKAAEGPAIGRGAAQIALALSAFRPTLVKLGTSSIAVGPGRDRRIEVVDVGLDSAAAVAAVRPLFGSTVVEGLELPVTSFPATNEAGSPIHNAVVVVRLLVTRVLGSHPEVTTEPVRCSTDPHRLLTRPLMGGVSVGHLGVSAGTLSAVLWVDGTPHILSAEHVLAPPLHGESDGVHQPGFIDRCADDSRRTQVGTLAWTSPARRERRTEAALATVEDRTAVQPGILGLDVDLEADLARDTARNSDLIAKSGRTSDVSRGLVTTTNLTLLHKGITYLDLLEYDDLTEAGDSGSMIVRVSDACPLAVHSWRLENTDTKSGRTWITGSGWKLCNLHSQLLAAGRHEIVLHEPA